MLYQSAKYSAVSHNRIFLLPASHYVSLPVFAYSRTYDGEVEWGLLGTKFILQFKSVATTVILVTRCYCQVAAVLCGRYGNAPTSWLDLNKRRQCI